MITKNDAEIVLAVLLISGLIFVISTLLMILRMGLCSKYKKEVDTEDILAILNRWETNYGNKCVRNAWSRKPSRLQDEEIEDFKHNMQKVKEYILSRK